MNELEKIGAALIAMNQIANIVEPRRVRDDDAWVRTLPLVDAVMAERPVIINLPKDF